jgi:FkbM family methyltransferase
MNEFNFTEVEIDEKKFKLKYYSQFENYYSNNGKDVEPQTRNWFLNNLTEEDVVFDVGAHIGLYTILFSQRTKNVYAFEPTSSYDTLLTPNLGSNGIDFVVTEKIAVGNQTGIVTDKIFRIWGAQPEESEYPFIKLDDYIYNKKIYPTFIKIDVDSFDYEVLLGTEKYLKEYNPYVCVECNYYALKYRNHETSVINHFMNSLGYTTHFQLDGENLIFKKNGVNN